MMSRKLKPDKVGYWSELKLEIVEKYAKAYSSILKKQSFLKGIAYVDAFSGMGVHVSKDDETTQVLGSPKRALEVTPVVSHRTVVALRPPRA